MQTMKKNLNHEIYIHLYVYVCVGVCELNVIINQIRQDFYI